MRQLSALKTGRIYFALAYEDDGLRYPIVHSYEYLGVSSEDSDVYMFRFLGTGDSLELTESQLDLILGVDELTEALEVWAKENPELSAEGLESVDNQVSQMTAAVRATKEAKRSASLS